MVLLVPLPAAPAQPSSPKLLNHTLDGPPPLPNVTHRNPRDVAKPPSVAAVIDPWRSVCNVDFRRQLHDGSHLFVLRLIYCVDPLPPLRQSFKTKVIKVCR